MSMNEKYSYKDFSDKEFTKEDPVEFNDSEIIGSCFYDEKIREVFPKDVRGLILTKCNLDNVILPNGVTVNGGCHRMIQVQNDLEDWIVDEENKPIEPVEKARLIRVGLSVDPKDLPVEKLDTSPYEAKVTQDIAAIDAQIKALEIQKKGVK